jgi:YidC/Oxa1 family membrane protein insertase
MEKRLFLAIAISMLVIMLYSGIASRFAPPPPTNINQEPVSSVLVPAPIIKETVLAEIPQDLQPIVADDVKNKIPLKILQNNDIEIVVTAIDSSIKECREKKYNYTLPQINIGSVPEWQKLQIKSDDITDGLAISYIVSSDIEARKIYKFTENKYIVEMTLEFINNSSTTRSMQYSLIVGSISDEAIKKDSIGQRYYECSISLPDKVLRGDFLRFKPNINSAVQWIGIRDRYFCTIVKPLQEIKKLSKISNAGLTSYVLLPDQFEVPAMSSTKHSYLIYLGPQESTFIEKLGSKAEYIINFGVFDVLSHMLLSALKFINNLSKNWGLTIILFSLLIFAVTSPLSIKSFRSMKMMQEVQPLIEELRVKYKDNPQRMHKEVMALYKEKKINPLGGCLPMVLQMPVFIALYQSLMRFVDLKGAQFLWIKDLSEPDKLVQFKSTYPIIGNELNLLPLIMIAVMLLQQKLTGSKGAADPSTAQQQKMMSLFMAVFFGFIFYHMPSGLVLYWTVNSMVMFVFQLKIIGRPK